MAVWCTKNNITLNSTKTKELIIGFRKHNTDHNPIVINGDCVERVPAFNFLVIHVAEDLIHLVTVSHHQILIHKHHSGSQNGTAEILRKNNLQEKLKSCLRKCLRTASTPERYKKSTVPNIYTH